VLPRPRRPSRPAPISRRAAAHRQRYPCCRPAAVRMKLSTAPDDRLGCVMQHTLHEPQSARTIWVELVDAFVGAQKWGLDYVLRERNFAGEEIGSALPCPLRRFGVRRAPALDQLVRHVKDSEHTPRVQQSPPVRQTTELGATQSPHRHTGRGRSSSTTRAWTSGVSSHAERAKAATWMPEQVLFRLHHLEHSGEDPVAPITWSARQR
jgi:hypothetical protein